MPSEQETDHTSRASADEMGEAETFRAELTSLRDHNEATKRFNSILGGLRDTGESVTVQVAVAEVDDGE